MATTEFTWVLGGPGVLSIWSKASDAAVAVVKVLRVTNSTAMTPDANGIWTITPANEEDTTQFYAFLDAALPVGSSAGVEATRTRESGSTVGGGSSGGTEYLIGVGGPKSNRGTGVDRKLSLFNVTVSGDSGGSTQTANTPTAPSIKFLSTAVTADTTVGFALIDAMPDDTGDEGALYLKGSGNETIPAGRSHEIVYVTAA